MVEAIGCLDNCEVVGSQPMLIYRHFLLQQTISVALRTPAALSAACSNGNNEATA